MSYKIGDLFQDNEGDIFMIVKTHQGVPKLIRYLFRNDGYSLAQEFSFFEMDKLIGFDKPFIIKTFNKS